MNTPEENIKTILADWLDALRRQDLDALAWRMAPDVFWQGIREDLVCEDREEAMEMLREQQREEHGVEAPELVATEEKVVLGVRSSQLREVGGVPLEGQIFQVFTLRDGIIVRVDEYERRGDALVAAVPKAGASGGSDLFGPGVRSRLLFHRSAWKGSACRESRRRSHCDHNSGSNRPKMGVFDA